MALSNGTSPTPHLIQRITLSEISIFQKIYLQKVGQGHGVQFSQCQRSMTNAKIYKILAHNFAPALTVSDILKLKMSYLEIVGQGHGVHFSH